MKKQTITLNEQENERLKSIVRKGQNKARVITRARILLLCHPHKADQEIADTLSIGWATVERIRRRCAREGLESALKDKPRPGQKRILTGRQEAQIIALTTSTPPRYCRFRSLIQVNWEWLTIDSMNTYSHILPSMQEEAAEKLDEMLRPIDVSVEFKKISEIQQVYLKNPERNKIG